MMDVIRKVTKILPITLFLIFIGFQSGLLAKGAQNGATAQAPVVQAEHAANALPDTFMVVPFILLLIMIATGPLLYKRFWEKHYVKVSLLLAFIVISYYMIFLNDAGSVLHTASEYISFIALLSSLFIVSGGILIKVDKKATPVLNVLFLFFGAVVSNIIGTTGASMLLIRPFIKMNRGRIAPYHIVFFIFIISNMGGALTPIGDPPLFLGFLKGVPFLWVIENVWYIWLPAIALALTAFYFYDASNKKESVSKTEYTGKVKISGYINFVYLGVIILAVFIDPGVISWVPSLSPLPFGLREVIMFAVSFAAYKKADIKILKANEFDFEPIKEVAFLFIGIFATMIPALQLIAHEAKAMGTKLDAGIFYWSSGALSSVLDNAPTYLNFLSAEMGKYGLNVNVKADVINFVLKDPLYLRAVSVGSVFFGAFTYIGNGPNFMVKSISEKAGIEMPGFMSYILKYSVIILLPLFTIIWLLFFFNRG
jgi:Na+/H+ antiporter NhaD/arsenite permease-like protein